MNHPRAGHRRSKPSAGRRDQVVWSRARVVVARDARKRMTRSRGKNVDDFFEQGRRMDNIISGRKTRDQGWKRAASAINGMAMMVNPTKRKRIHTTIGSCKCVSRACVGHLTMCHCVSKDASSTITCLGVSLIR